MSIENKSTTLVSSLLKHQGYFGSRNKPGSVTQTDVQEKVIAPVLKSAEQTEKMNAVRPNEINKKASDVLSNLVSKVKNCLVSEVVATSQQQEVSVEANQPVTMRR